MESSSGSDVAQLERELNELQARAAQAEIEAAAAEDAEHLRAAVAGQRGRRWTPIAVGIGLAVAAALALPAESLFTTPRAFAARARGAVPASVHVVITAVLTTAFALPGLVVGVAYVGARNVSCSTYARVRVTAAFALISWIATALVWAWLRRRRPARTDALSLS